MRSRKIIKKIIKITAILLLLFFALPATSLLLLQNKGIQTSLVNKVVQVVARNLGTKFTIGRIDISFFYRIRMNKVYLEDTEGDTLLYVEKLTAGIRRINPVKKVISIGSINFDHATVGLTLDSTRTINLKYFIDKLSGNKKGKGKWDIDFNNIRLRNTRFYLRNYYYEPRVFGVNYTDIEINKINADLSNFTPSKDSLFFHIRTLQFIEKSGFWLNQLACDFSQSRKFLVFRNLEIKTPSSNVKGDEISLRFNDWSNFKADSFFRLVRLNIELKHSRVNFADVGFFAPSFQQINQLVDISGQVRGPVSNLKSKNLEVHFGKDSFIRGEINFEGLPDIHNTFIYASIKDLSSNASDLNDLNLPGLGKLKIPNRITKLGTITYKGKFTGFLTDFVAYGKFSTQLGVVSTDLLLRPDTLNMIGFEGQLNAKDFNLGELLNATDNIGKISLSANLNGESTTTGVVNATLKGMIQELEFRKYRYTHINLSGNLKNKTFNGSVEVKDPNVELEFLGQVNLSDSIAKFDFTANVTDANLYALNIERSEPDFTTSFYLIAKAQGNSINGLNGEIRLLNSLFTKKDRQLQIYDLSINADNDSLENHIQLNSDFMDVDISGKFELTKLYESLKQLEYTYLPAIKDSGIRNEWPFQNGLNVRANIKNARSVFNFFLPDYYLAENTTMVCNFMTGNQEMDLTFRSPLIKIKGITWNNLNIMVNGNRQALNLEAGGKYFMLGDRIKLENFTVFTDASQDTMGIRIRWNNWQDLEYRGNIKAFAQVTRPDSRRAPHVNIDFYPARVITNDTVWNLKPGRIMIDSSRISVENLLVSHGNDYFRFDGVVSKNPEDKLSLIFNHFNLGNLNGITLPSGFELAGILNGNATVSDIYGNSLFTSLMTIDSLMINQEMLGNTQINSTWDDMQDALHVDAHTMRDNLKTIDIKGVYKPAGEGNLDFSLKLDKLRLNIFNPYVSTIFNDMKGIATGGVSLTGSVKKPLLNGEINLQKTAFTVNYLRTRYNFTEKVQIENNNIYFKNIRVYDPKGNSAYLTGAIRSRYLRDFQLDLSIRSENFLCMNTTQADNKLFYGTAYATGLVKISGPPKNITMDITARTNKNTLINIPLSNEGQLNEYNFITITTKDYSNEPEEEPEIYQVDLSGMQINFNLEVTPDAEVQIIFDPKLGDIIKGKGNGNLDMKINTAGTFLMYGEYVIDEGDYLFTLQNIINKRFNIESGGRIRWNGDPFDATIDIVANYRTKAALIDLLGNLGEANEKYSKAIVVDDRLTMTGRLMAPEINYDIYLPLADEDTRRDLDNAITSSEELNRQFISLLIQNRFVLSSERQGYASGLASASPYSNAAGVSASEFLTNQLSHWLSQISNDVDVGINYRSNREMKSDEVQVALSTQLFNDRLTINGSVDVATNATANASDNIVGEFDIDYKLTRNGKLRIKTFNHVNNDLLDVNSIYTQGLGLSYKEEFNSVGELWKRYLQNLFGTGKKPDDVEEKKDDGTDEQSLLK